MIPVPQILADLRRFATAVRRAVVARWATAVGVRVSNRSVTLAVGFSPWKENFTRRLLRDRIVLFVDDPSAFRAIRGRLARHPIDVVVWSSKEVELGFEAGDFAGLELSRLEDGFVRSIGRGIDRTPPWSLCRDRTGLYFDATRPSDLETACIGLTEADHAAAAPAIARTIERLKGLQISKYNATRTPGRPNGPPHEPGSVLVLGQVEDDQSIRCNTNEISTNRDLIERAIADNPGRRILFKQHPDCLGARRRGGHVDVASLPSVVEVDPAVGIAEAIEAVDTVYTISSLGGFEALLRGREVVTFGGPFYAGWGLTRDHVRFPRRRRTLTVEELFHVAFVRYPIYFDPDTGERTNLDAVLDHFSRVMSGAR